MLNNVPYNSAILSSQNHGKNVGTTVFPSIFIISNDERIQLNVPYFSQLNDISDKVKEKVGSTACGPAVVAMALKYIKLDVTLDNVISKLPNSVYIKGKGFNDILGASKYFDKESVKVAQNPKAIYETLKQGFPVILNIQNFDGISGHAVLVTGIKGFDGKKAYSLIVNDPYYGSLMEYKYISANSLLQPKGYINTIGPVQPFYIK